MAISESRRRNNDNYNAKCDYITLRPLRPIGTDIRNAAAGAGLSNQGYILQAVRDKMARDGFQPEAEWPCAPAEAHNE
jgi:hypothetical protein